MKDKILKDREEKQKKVKDFFNLYPDDSLIVIKANIPGDNKNYPFISYLLKVFLNDLKTTYNFMTITYNSSFDGPYYFCGIKGKNKKIKEHLIMIEETHDLGRFIDLDFFITPEHSQSRTLLGLPLRKCILCDNDAVVCMRKGSHTLDKLLDKIEKRIVFYFAEVVLDLVDYSVIRELRIDSKFGLVTFTSSGSHKDMNYQTMISAKDAILYYFKKMFLAGYATNELSKVLNKVRSEGIEAEKRMLAATSGVNAYKGVIFLLGITAIAFGYTLKTSTKFTDIFTNIKTISANIYDDFLTDYDSSGVRLYKKHNITGIRGVAKSGLELIKDNLTKINLDSTDKDLRNLLYYYILNTDDTVFITRSKSYDNYLKYKKEISNYDPNNKEDLKALNLFAESHNLSFGGAADLLIVTIFLINLKELFIK